MTGFACGFWRWHPVRNISFNVHKRAGPWRTDVMTSGANGLEPRMSVTTGSRLHPKKKGSPFVVACNASKKADVFLS